MYKLEKAKLDNFLGIIAEGRELYALERAESQYHLVRSDAWQAGKHTLGAFRQVEPLKALVFRPRELLGSLGGAAPDEHIPERIVIGAKNCDVAALKIHDYVFLNTAPVDPVYKEAREKTIIVSCDCTDACEVCFCPAVKEQPYPKAGFDVNLSPTDLGYVVEAGSERGKQLLKKAESLLSAADAAILKARDQNRQELCKKVCAQTEKMGLACGADLRQAVEKSQGKKIWDDFAEDCVECGACNLICCTCHCFLLADGKGKNGANYRVKQWDSCLYRNFAAVAGGANPRRHRAERLYNRFDKKFSFFPQVLGSYACEGCGRCVEACTGKIDIREVLKRAVNEL
ncbi:MAG: 4Fe-4S dicluster domain-containing protein [Kiritimatiellaeota bacterium]|nr:4Fe-4S dicluster domain-containing protein [Kiritimatiellota bacterium]